MVLRDSPE